MTKQEFLQRFRLNPLYKSDRQKDLLTQPKHLTQSAVLIILSEQDEQLHVLLTKRANHLKHHAGQICFPGGKVENDDQSFVATAIREAQEEIGLNPEKIKVIGQLHPYQTITGFSITPVVALLDSCCAYKLDKNEVDEIFHVPLQHFFSASNHHTIEVQLKTGHHQVHFMPYKRHNIWGATAAIIKDLSQLINSQGH